MSCDKLHVGPENPLNVLCFSEAARRHPYPLIAHRSQPQNLFFYITAQRDGHAELASASHCEPLLTPFPR